MSMMLEEGKRQCAFVRKDKTRCRSFKMKTSPFCFIHNPKVAVKRKAANLKGGMTGKRTLSLASVFIKNPKDVAAFLVKVINEVRQGKLTRQEANSLAYISGQLIKSQEVGSLEERLIEIEKAMKAMGKEPQE